jgi:hypothetical protein
MRYPITCSRLRWMDGDVNLRREGAPSDRVFQVGNVMIDTLRRYEHVARARSLPLKHGLTPKEYILCTLHRPSNVDDEQTFKNIVSVIRLLSQERVVVFPVHPRTRARMSAFALDDQFADKRLLVIDPLGYLDFLSLMADAAPCSHRLRRNSGRDDRVRHPLSDAPRKHRASGHGNHRDQSYRWNRYGTHFGGCSSSLERELGARRYSQWVGRESSWANRRYFD